ncbi:COG3014 family protein [Agarivorans sp. QJM3NY_33]|uniref:COG3014 family protein n=1 Tax=Agarivorans sp. QJM3NY_33 TaxID=3421432 RepID=UPI003D7C9EB9
MHQFWRVDSNIGDRRSQLRCTWPKIAIFVIAALVTGCSTAVFSDLFTTYSEQLRASRYQLTAGQFEHAAELLAEGKVTDNSYYLKQLELGRMLFLAGDFEASQQHFSRVDQQLKWLSSQAEYRLSTGLQQFSTLATNDNFIRYHIPVYEQVMLHHYQAINYLHSGGLESALVEIRRAGQLQQLAMEEQPVSLETQLQDYQQQYDELLKQYPSPDTTLPNAYQNGLSYALSAVLYMAAGQDNDAYIDYRKALALAPKNHYLQAEVARLGQKLAMSDYQQYTPLKAQPLTEDQGLLVVLHEQSIVAARQEVRFTLPLYHQQRWQTYTLALPVISTKPQLAIPLALSLEGHDFATQQLVQIDALAAKQLQQDLPAVLVRQILRVLAKDQLRREVNQGDAKKGENWANVFANVYNIVSERADTRSWQSLPALAQIAIKPFAVGKHKLTMSGLGESEVSVNIRPGRVTLVLTNDLGSTVQLFNL